MLEALVKLPIEIQGELVPHCQGSVEGVNPPLGNQNVLYQRRASYIETMAFQME